MKDSSKATSFRELDCQHLTSSKFAPSLEARTLTSPAAYAQFTLTPKATRREFNLPVHVTPQREGHGRARTTNMLGSNLAKTNATAICMVISARCSGPLHGCHLNTSQTIQFGKNDNIPSHIEKTICQYPEPPESACSAPNAGEPAKLPTE